MTDPSQPMPFGDVPEAVERLTAEEQEALSAILQRRLAARARQRLARDVAEARAEFERGECEARSVDELAAELEA